MALAFMQISALGFRKGKILLLQPPADKLLKPRKRVEFQIQKSETKEENRDRYKDTQCAHLSPGKNATGKRLSQQSKAKQKIQKKKSKKPTQRQKSSKNPTSTRQQVEKNKQENKQSGKSRKTEEIPNKQEREKEQIQNQNSPVTDLSLLTSLFLFLLPLSGFNI